MLTPSKWRSSHHSLGSLLRDCLDEPPNPLGYFVIVFYFDVSLLRSLLWLPDVHGGLKQRPRPVERERCPQKLVVARVSLFGRDF
jgi:hypothetical protein